MTFTRNLALSHFDLGRLATQGSGLIPLWLERTRQRRDLRGLDARLLTDIGLSRYDAEREAAKPFWRA
jgi:uncharacterized protein YjiS (DUF1127 family)